MPRLTFAEPAIADILAQAEWYKAQAGQELATRWDKAVSSTVLRILRMPRAGALCAFRAGELRGIRRISITGFPAHLVFYQFREDEIHVLRVLHGARDLESLFS